MLTVTSRQRWRPGVRAVLLSLLLVTHFFCGAGAIGTAAAAETDGSAVVAASAVPLVEAPASEGPDREHYLCETDAGAGTDQRTAAAAAAVPLGLGTGSALLQAVRSPVVLWRSPAAVAIPWSGMRLLFSLGVQRV